MAASVGEAVADVEPWQHPGNRRVDSLMEACLAGSGGILDDELLADVSPGLITEVGAVLASWNERWREDVAFRSILFHHKLQHEVEECLLAIQCLLNLLDKDAAAGDDITLVDLCAGKGILASLISYLAGRRPDLFRRIKRVLAVELKTADQVDFKHIQAANEDVEARGLATGANDAAHGSRAHLAAVPIELLCGMNIHDEPLEERLRSEGGKLAIIGIHLCKGLSPRAIGLFNILGPTRAPLLVLAPCCVPRMKGPPIVVPLWEPEDERAVRLKALMVRKMILQRRPKNALPGEDPGPKDWPEGKPCFRCGLPGHRRADCTAKQASNQPPRPNGPVVLLDKQPVMESDDPFAAWCEALRNVVQAEPSAVELRVTASTASAKDSDERNWNRFRKLTWLTCSRSPDICAE